jgi:prepilin-type N-terminal cleavage/methylation domain-containing protein
MRGITLIEMLCVVGLFSICAAFSLSAGTGALKRTRAGGDAVITASALRSVRASAMHHSCIPGNCESYTVSISTSTLVVHRGLDDIAFPIARSLAHQEMSFNPDGRLNNEVDLPFGDWTVHGFSDGGISVDAGK